MNFNKIEFETSAGNSSQLPEKGKPEIVFSGHSNVGKSSLINKLVQRKNLARVSSQPGKTATINFFNAEEFKLVDGEFMGAKDYMNKLMTDDATKSAFVIEPAGGNNEGGDPQPPNQPQFSQQQRQPQNPPKPKKTLADWMKAANEHPEMADSIKFD